ncbi:MAG: Ferrochelatase [Turneriella sp.]|nr:Ferrochelatase [Turneriella sp.]
MNLGSPTAPTAQAVNAFLKEFLMDARVISTPYILRWVIVHLFILPFRIKRGVEAYKKIWLNEGSPLIFFTESFAQKLEKILSHRVYTAMRYGNPSLQSVLQKIQEDGHRKLLVVPLYPQYAVSTTQSAIERVKELSEPLGIESFFVKPFFEEDAYIKNLVKKIKPVLKKCDHLLFSYHSLPVRHIIKANAPDAFCFGRPDCCTIPKESSPQAMRAHQTCYQRHCVTTTEKVAQSLKLKREKYSLAFQSRVGREKWLLPQTNEVVKYLAENGVRRLAIVAPAFVADNLETLYEIKIELKKIFHQTGGERFEYIACLNDETTWVKDFSSLLQNVNTLGHG